MIRQTAVLVTLAVLFCGAVPGRSEGLINLTTGVRYDTFSSDQSREKGDQLFTPIGLSYGNEGGFFGGLATGYVDSTYRPPEEGAEDVHVSTLIDTNLTLFYTTPLLGGCFRVGSTFNLPTGKATLTEEERKAEMDREYGDLVEVTDFGEGTNANPGFAYTIPLGDFTVGVAMSRHVRGSYDPTVDVENDEVDPGDETHTKVNVNWKGETLEVLAGFKYLAVDPDEVGGTEVFEEGDMLALNSRVKFHPAGWLFLLEGSYNTWYKGKRYTGGGTLAVEEFDRYGDDLVLYGLLEYQLLPALAVYGSFRGRWVQDNDYPSDSELYDGGRSGAEGTAGFVYMFIPGIFLKGSLGYQQVDDLADAGLSEDTTYKGWKSALNIESLF